MMRGRTQRPALPPTAAAKPCWKIDILSERLALLTLLHPVQYRADQSADMDTSISPAPFAVALNHGGKGRAVAPVLPALSGADTRKYSQGIGSDSTDTRVVHGEPNA